MNLKIIEHIFFYWGGGGAFIDDGCDRWCERKGEDRGGMTYIKGPWGGNEPTAAAKDSAFCTWHILYQESYGGPHEHIWKLHINHSSLEIWQCDAEQVSYLSTWRPTGLQREGTRDLSHTLVQSTGGFWPIHLSGYINRCAWVFWAVCRFLESRELNYYTLKLLWCTQTNYSN